jgi:hypothetical protein
MMAPMQLSRFTQDIACFFRQELLKLRGILTGGLFLAF